ncbi:MAG: hypothetical protein U0795_13610 [Pirellulales bacterium]
MTVENRDQIDDAIHAEFEAYFGRLLGQLRSGLAPEDHDFELTKSGPSEHEPPPELTESGWQIGPAFSWNYSVGCQTCRAIRANQVGCPNVQLFVFHTTKWTSLTLGVYWTIPTEDHGCRFETETELLEQWKPNASCQIDDNRKSQVADAFLEAVLRGHSPIQLTHPSAPSPPTSASLR